MKRIILSIILLAFPFAAVAIGIQVSPDKLVFELANGKTLTQEIIVANPTTDVQLFEVYPDDYERAIKVNPASFTLEAGRSGKVQITLDASRFPTGQAMTTLSVLSKPLAQGKIQVNTGIKILVIVAVGAEMEKGWPWIGVAGLAFIVVVGLARVWVSKRQN